MVFPLSLSGFLHFSTLFARIFSLFFCLSRTDASPNVSKYVFWPLSVVFLFCLLPWVDRKVTDTWSVQFGGQFESNWKWNGSSARRIPLKSERECGCEMRNAKSRMWKARERKASAFLLSGAGKAHPPKLFPRSLACHKSLWQLLGAAFDLQFDLRPIGMGKWATLAKKGGGSGNVVRATVQKLAQSDSGKIMYLKSRIRPEVHYLKMKAILKQI